MSRTYKLLPLTPSQAKILVLRNGDDEDPKLKVRKQKVLDALDWLKANNRLYKDIDIDYAVDLPEDGTIYDVPGLELIEPDEADKMEKVLPESEK